MKEESVEGYYGDSEARVYEILSTLPERQRREFHATMRTADEYERIWAEEEQEERARSDWERRARWNPRAYRPQGWRT